MSTSTRTVRTSPATRGAVALIAAAVIAVTLNAVVATIASGRGIGAGFTPLTFPVYASFTVVGVLIGWLGWRIVQRRAARPTRVLSILVPVVTLASFVPDLLLMNLRFIPGTTNPAVITLMVMHVVVVAIAVPAYAIASRTAR